MLFLMVLSISSVLMLTACSFEEFKEEVLSVIVPSLKEERLAVDPSTLKPVYIDTDLSSDEVDEILSKLFDEESSIVTYIVWGLEDMAGLGIRIERGYEEVVDETTGETRYSSTGYSISIMPTPDGAGSPICLYNSIPGLESGDIRSSVSGWCENIDDYSKLEYSSYFERDYSKNELIVDLIYQLETE